MKPTALVIFLAGVGAVVGDKARFDHYRVYSIEIQNEQQLKVLQDLEDQQDGLTFTKPATTTETLAEIIVPPHKLADISELCEKFEMKNEIISDNLQK